jgi:hypothetical protein
MHAVLSSLRAVRSSRVCYRRSAASFFCERGPRRACGSGTPASLFSNSNSKSIVTSTQFTQRRSNRTLPTPPTPRPPSASHLCHWPPSSRCRCGAACQPALFPPRPRRTHCTENPKTAAFARLSHAREQHGHRGVAAAEAAATVTAANKGGAQQQQRQQQTQNSTRASRPSVPPPPDTNARNCGGPYHCLGAHRACNHACA